MGRNIESLSENLRAHPPLLDGLSNNPIPSVKSKPSAQIIWAKGSSILKDNLDRQIYTAWIKPLCIDSVKIPKEYPTGENVQVTLLAPNKFCCEHVRRNYGELISSTLNDVIGTKETTLNFRVSKTILNKRQEENQKKNLPNKTAKPTHRTNQSSSRSKRHSLSSVDGTNLNPRYNFSNYIVGSCNQFAHAVSIKAAESLGATYNPLFIYGGVGLGKTHLANAIGNSARRRGKKVLLISSETFVSELITALRTNNMTSFKNRLRTLDLLIVDDIQFLMGKERTQEEFFHTFNELYNRGRQIVLTSDKVPAELIGLEERLRTRFASGLSADLQAPDLETRTAILIKKSEANNIELPESVARFLAERIDSNVRELEGALNRLSAYCSMRNIEPSVALAEEILTTISPRSFREISPQLIQRLVAEKFNIGINDLLGKRRTLNIAQARQVAMYLCRKMTACSYPEIGVLFGGRDHSTVIHANKTVLERMSKNKGFRSDIESLEKKIR